MPRIARNDMTGTFFHIMVQGINKECIFEKDDYKEQYKNILKTNLEKFQIKIISYCIMNNHTHILIYCDNINNMIKFMHNVNTSYGIFYNKINNRVGYVFRDRYKTQKILNEKHLKNCIVYIHKNPVKAKIVENEEEYKYSSYNEYIKNSKIVDIKFVIDTLGIVEQSNFIKYTRLLHRKEDIEDNFIDVEIRKDLNDDEVSNIIKKYKNKGLKDSTLVNYLIKNYNISQREIAKKLNLTRYKVRELLK